MSIKYKHLKGYVIEPTLREIQLYSPAATELLLGTAAHESLGGYFLRQEPTGPGAGIYQMEKTTLVDLWENWLRFRLGSADHVVAKLGLSYPDHDRLVWDLRYATVWARLNYYRAPEPLPSEHDIGGLGDYWYRHWCKGCAGTVSQWTADYLRYRSN